MIKLQLETSAYTTHKEDQKMAKECSVSTYELFVDFLKLRRRILDRVYAITSYKTPLEVVNMLEASENNYEFIILKEKARLITPHANSDFLLSTAWWQEQGIDFDLSYKIVP